MDGQHRIEKMSEMDAVGFGDEAKKGTVTVKAPGPPLLDYLDPRLVVAIKEFVCDLPVRRLVGEFERFRAEPAGLAATTSSTFGKLSCQMCAMSSVIVWDLETIPDIKGFAAANGHTGKSDDEIRAAMGDKFPKHIYHSIICIGALVAHQQDGLTG
jgi:hypothetical protein